jgi:hypothetical protein
MLNKSQVRSFLEVISSDESREVLTYAYIDLYKGRPVLVATNSYILAAIYLPDELKEHVGKFISRADITRWYKLAKAKDMLGANDLLEMASGDKPFKYPDWQRLIDSQEEQGPERSGATDKISFDAKYAMTLQSLAGQQLVYTLHGRRGVMVAVGLENKWRETGLYLLMPMMVE